MIRDHLDHIETSLRALRQTVAAETIQIEQELQRQRDHWPSHQMVKIDDWHARDETPPPGVLWASDGSRVWLFHTDGEPISATATAVKFWTAALIPAPPAPAKI